ncbi:MAG: Gfo/Idh/MocA family oxidoreductase [Defluviitaleaceae bacterium]|nr:Gfo/Idh/MocA family oxidoreductase [Defluviitaleaceae bacterium]
MTPLKAIMIGAGQRGNSYAPHAISHSDDLKFVAVAEPVEVRRNAFAEKYDINEENRLNTWEDVFARDRFADVVIICTPDDLHFGPVMAAIEKGYDILLEKPISPSPEECVAVAKAAEEKGVKVIVCHVMRYTPFCMAIKSVIESGEIGRIVTIVHNENVGHIHHSHSFARGNWRNKKESSPMILAKSCHDMDMLQWLVGKKCLRLSSFGSLTYFNKDNCPPDAPFRCTDGCAVADCPYDARKLYLNSKNDWFRSVAVGRFNSTDEEVLEALKTGWYGRCVYQCDNDVVDHQVVSMQFEDDITAIFSMSSFTPETSRSIKIMGTKGQIKGHTSSKNIIVTSFITGETREIDASSTGGHGGGDAGIMTAFVRHIRGEKVDGISDATISAENHMLCFAAEESRLDNGRVIEL